jgi:DNA polymerase sigma
MRDRSEFDEDQIYKCSQLILSSKVPVIKTRDAKTKISLDIVIEHGGEMELAAFYNILLNVYPGSLTLILIFKKILKAYNLNEGKNGGATGSTACAMIFAYYQFHNTEQRRHIDPNKEAKDLVRFLFSFLIQTDNWREMVVDLTNGEGVTLDESGFVTPNCPGGLISNIDTIK